MLFPTPFFFKMTYGNSLKKHGCSLFKTVMFLIENMGDLN